MPPRYSYWTIIAGGLPTAFRAAERDELLPTFTRIKHKHPDAEMKWFARGKLWESPEAAREATRRSDVSPASRPQGPGRGRDWRPGGEHRDPRQKYRDAKKTRNTENRKRKFQRREFDARGKGAADRRSHGKGPVDRRSQDQFQGKRRWPTSRTFEKKAFPRHQGNEEPPERTPPPERPSREPKRREGNEPTPPPRPTEPIIAPPGPPERGRRHPARRPGNPKRDRRR